MGWIKTELGEWIFSHEREQAAFKYAGAHRHFECLVYPKIHGWDYGVDVYHKTWWDFHGDQPWPKNPTSRPGAWWAHWRLEGVKARFFFEVMLKQAGATYVGERWWHWDPVAHAWDWEGPTNAEVKAIIEGKSGGKDGKGKGPANVNKGKGTDAGKGKGKMGLMKNTGKAKGKNKSKDKAKKGLIVEVE